VDIVLDPGHGGPTEPGTVGANGVVEADVNLAVAQLVAAKLEAAGYRAILTRGGDYRIPIASRAAIADALQAPLVSIQHNGGEANPAAKPGSEVIYRRDAPEARRLAGLIWEEAMAKLSGFSADWVAGGDAGATYRLGSTDEDYFGIVRLPASAAVLAEMSYLGNPSEARLLAQPGFLDAEAHAVADAIVRWLATSDPGSGFVEPSYRLTTQGGTGGSSGCVDPPLD
jgi:N-acetylmuramoyl-L-alanine amidase